MCDPRDMNPYDLNHVAKLNQRRGRSQRNRPKAGKGPPWLDAIYILLLLAEQGPYTFEVEDRLFCHNCTLSFPYNNSLLMSKPESHNRDCAWRMAVEKIAHLRENL